jgi:hypothetical protein
MRGGDDANIPNFVIFPFHNIFLLLVGGESERVRASLRTREKRSSIIFSSAWKVLKLTNVMTYFLWLNGKGHKADFFLLVK